MKNNKLINSLAMVAARNREEHVRVASERDTPQIYAALAIALWGTLDIPNEEDRADAIETIFAKSQEIWTKHWREDMVKLCEDITGIDLVGRIDDADRI